jgi:hypothetical protein
MQLAAALDSKVVHSAERFCGKYEHSQTVRQLVSGVDAIAISPPLPRRDFFLSGYVESVALQPSNGDRI